MLCEYYRPLEIKAVGEDGRFTGYAAIYGGSPDRLGDVIVPGAAKASIAEQPEVPVLWVHDIHNPIGIARLSEDPNGVLAEGVLPVQDLPEARKALALMRLGALRGLSIGYDIGDWGMRGPVRELKAIRIREISLAPTGLQANPDARVTAVKTVVPFQDLPLAEEDRSWDARAAIERVRAWSGSTDGPSARYRRAFLWYDPERADEFGAYKLPIADVIDGELRAVPRALFAAAARLSQADIPAADVPAVQRHIERYYRKMGRESPFADTADNKVAAPSGVAAVLEALERLHHVIRGV